MTLRVKYDRFYSAVVHEFIVQKVSDSMANVKEVFGTVENALFQLFTPDGMGRCCSYQVLATRKEKQNKISRMKGRPQIVPRLISLPLPPAGTWRSATRSSCTRARDPIQQKKTFWLQIFLKNGLSFGSRFPITY